MVSLWISLLPIERAALTLHLVEELVPLALHVPAFLQHLHLQAGQLHFALVTCLLCPVLKHNVLLLQVMDSPC